MKSWSYLRKQHPWKLILLTVSLSDEQQLSKPQKSLKRIMYQVITRRLENE